MSRKKANEILLDVTYQYQHIPFRSTTIKVPYFINTAEQIYKQTMRNVGIDENLVKDVIKQIKDGKTPLGSAGGKGSPHEIAQDLSRLIAYLNNLGFNPTSKTAIRAWMTTMHIGLDCAGYVYNIILELQRQLKSNIIDKLAWRDENNKKPSHAGVFIFDSDQLEQVESYEKLTPLDILIFDDQTHVGIMCNYKNTLHLADCSIGKNGIFLSKLIWQNGKALIQGSRSWTRLLNNKKVKVRRLTF